MSSELLDKWDVVEGLANKIFNVIFENENGENVYVASAERTAEDQLVVETTDGFKFTLTCEEFVKTIEGGA
jgi:hypothetical protein